VQTSDVAKPLSYKTKTTNFLKTKTALKIIKLLIQDLKKRSLTEKIGPVLPSHAGNRKKKTAYYRLCGQVLLHPKLGF